MGSERCQTSLFKAMGKDVSMGSQSVTDLHLEDLSGINCTNCEDKKLPRSSPTFETKPEVALTDIPISMENHWHGGISKDKQTSRRTGQ